MPVTNDPFTDVLLGYRPRTAWDSLTPEQHKVAGPNPLEDPLGSDTREMLGLPQWRSAPLDYITPEQKDTALKYLGRGAMTSAGALGSYLDKYLGSRALRGGTGALLNVMNPTGGHKGSWRELMSIIPGSDWMGLTDPNDSPTGKQVGAIKDDPNSWWDDIAGFGIEMALDPSLFVGGFLKGGLTAGGKALSAAGGLRDVDWALKSAARAAGSDAGRITARRATALGDALKALPDQNVASSLMDKLGQAAGNPSVLDDWLKAPIGTSLDVGVPFSEKMRTGFNVPGVVDKWRDKLGGAVSGSMLGRAVQNQLYAPAKGMTTKLGQDVAKQVSYVQGKTPEFLETIIGEAAELKAAGKWTPADKIKMYRELEGFTTNQNPNAIQEIIDHINGPLKADRNALAMGDDLKDMFIDLAQGKKYVPRYGLKDPAKEAAEYAGRSYAPVLDSKGADITRSPALKNVRGGTGSLMEIMMDDDVIALSKSRTWRRDLPAFLDSKFGNMLPEHVKDPDLMMQLAEVIHKTPDAVLKEGFFEHPLESLYKYINKSKDKTAISRAQIELMAHGTTDAARIAERYLKSGKTVGDAIASGDLAKFEDLFTRRPRGENWVTSSNMQPHYPIYDDLADVAKHKGKNPASGGAYVEYIKKFGTDAQKQELEGYRLMYDGIVQSGNPQVYDTLINGSANSKGMKQFFDDIGKNTLVPGAVMEDVIRWDHMFQPGSQIGTLGKWWDKATNLFKAGVLTWPARYVRDAFSGQVQNVLLNQWSMSGANDALKFIQHGTVSNPKKYLSHLPKARVDAMTEEQALKALKAHLASTGMLGDQHTPLAQLGNVKPKPGLEGVLQNMPGSTGHPLAAMAAELKGLKTLGGINPLGFRGVMGETTTNVAGRIGDIAGRTTDNLNKLVAYLTLKGRGVDANEALRRVMASQVDYSTKSLTSTERNILTRAFPFWRYSSKMFPFVFQEILDRPGGAMAQVIRASGKVGGGKGDFVPEHLRQSMALPLGGMLGSKDPKRQRYLTGLGLMHEDPLSVFQPGQNISSSVENTLKDLLGRANPLLKAPAEMAFGKQLFSGRELADLDGTIARILTNVTGSEDVPQIPSVVEHFLANSPLSRTLTSIRTATDPAKGAGARAVNLLTGVRVSDVDMEKAREIAIRGGIEDLLRGEKAVRTLRPHMYVKAEDRKDLDPTELMLMDLYSQQLSEAKRRKMNASRKLSTEEILNLARSGAPLDFGRGLP